MFQAYKLAAMKQPRTDHSHDEKTHAFYHDGPGGHQHDDDGHVHDELLEQFHVPEPQHDGPHEPGHKSGDGHTNHQQITEDVPKSEESPTVESVTDEENIRDITLTIAKLLFHLSQN